MMDDDIDDIRKLDDILKKESENQNNVQQEFEDLLDYISDDEEPLEGFEMEPPIDFTEFDINKLDEIASNYYNIDNTNFSSDLNIIKRYLEKDEIRILNSCKDPELKNVMVLNRVKNIQLQNIQIKLYEALKKCTASIRDTEQKIKVMWTNSNFPLKSILPKLGYPYFKTKESLSCRPNSDAIRRRNNKEIFIDYMPQVSRWTLEDQVILKRAVIFNYHNARIECLENKLKTLNATRKKCTDEKMLLQINIDLEKCEMELLQLKNRSSDDPPPLNCKNEISWLTISNEDLKNRHSSYACEAFWNIYLHPSINKSNWTDTENNKIVKLVEEYSFQNWDAIAAELHNNRSGFSVCVHYCTKISERFRKCPFEPEEDEFLLEVISSCRIGSYIPWSKVAHYFEHRTKPQIYHRYKYNLMYKNTRKGLFTEAEDVLLLCLIDRFGIDFQKCHKYMQNRTPVQLSCRYNNYLKYGNLNFGNWTIAEDRKILDHVKEYGPKHWAHLLDILRRNRTHIRQRYITMKKWMANNPNKSIEKMRRKRQTYKQKSILRTIRATADLFKTSVEIPSLEMIKDNLKTVDKNIVLKSDDKPSNNFIDSDLISFFQSTCKIKTGKTVTEESLQQIVGSLKILFTLLEVSLDIPDKNSLYDNPLLDQLDIEILHLLMQDFNMNKDISEKNTIFISLPGPSENKQLIKMNTSLDTGTTNLVYDNYSALPKEISYLPPNMNTLVGLRSMLITFNSFKIKKCKRNVKNKLNAKNKIIWSTEQDFIKFDDETRERILKERGMFQKRFSTLFIWPALMSVVEPHEKLTVLSNQALPKLKHKVGRPKKDLTKINLMLEARKRKMLEKMKNKKGIDMPYTYVKQKILNKTDLSKPQKEHNTKASNKYNLAEEQKNPLCGKTVIKGVFYAREEKGDIKNVVKEVMPSSHHAPVIEKQTSNSVINLSNKSMPAEQNKMPLPEYTLVPTIVGNLKPVRRSIAVMRTGVVQQKTGIKNKKTEGSNQSALDSSSHSKRQHSDGVLMCDSILKKLKTEISIDDEVSTLNKDISMLDEVLKSEANIKVE